MGFGLVLVAGAAIGAVVLARSKKAAAPSGPGAAKPNPYVPPGPGDPPPPPAEGEQGWRLTVRRVYRDGRPEATQHYLDPAVAPPGETFRWLEQQLLWECQWSALGHAYLFEERRPDRGWQRWDCPA